MIVKEDWDLGKLIEEIQQEVKLLYRTMPKSGKKMLRQFDATIQILIQSL